MVLDTRASAWPTPLLAPDSPLDAHARDVVAALFRGEQHLMAALPTDDPRDPKRLARVQLTRGEMFAQPEAIRATWAGAADTVARLAKNLAAGPPDRLVLTGCGDSLAVMLGVRLLLEDMLGVVCEPVQALDLAYYGRQGLGPGTLVVGLSSSGATTRTVEALLVARARGARTLALSNTPDSPLMTEADDGLLVLAQRRGWPTQSSTAAMALLCRLAVRIGHLMGRPGADAMARALDTLPEVMGHVLATCDADVEAIAREDSARSLYVYAGGGPAFAAAQFGAVKMKECSPDHAVAVPLEEFHHYNSLKAGDPLFVLAPAGPSVSRARDTAFEGRRWGGRIIGVVNGDETALDPFCDRLIRLPPVPEALAAFTFVLPVQLYAYHVAMEKFRRAGASGAI